MKEESSKDTAATALTRTGSTERQEQSQPAWSPDVFMAHFTCDLTCSLDTFSLRHLTQEEAGAAAETFLFLQGSSLVGLGPAPPAFLGAHSSPSTLLFSDTRRRGCTCGSCFRTFCPQRRLRRPKVNTPRGMRNHFVCFVLFVYVNTE